MAFGQIFYIEFEKVRTRIGAASHIYEIESLSVKPQFRSSQHDQSKSKKNSKMKNEENTERWKRWIDGDGTNGDDICKHLLAKCFWCKCVNAGMCVFLACLLACACVCDCACELNSPHENISGKMDRLRFVCVCVRFPKMRLIKTICQIN